MPCCRSTSSNDLQTREGPGVKLDFSQPSELKSRGVKREDRRGGAVAHSSQSSDVTLRENGEGTQETGAKYAMGIAVKRQGSSSAAEGYPGRMQRRREHNPLKTQHC